VISPSGMSTLLGSIICRRSAPLGLLAQQQARLGGVSAKWLTTSCIRSTTSQTQTEDYWEKNKRLNRPMSPHLTIYKFQITSVLSITHRMTGLALSGLASGFAIGMMLLPHNFPHYYNILCSSNLGSACLFAAKFTLALPFIYHFCNGIRHLFWDMGKGFQIKEVYTSGYVMLGASLLLTLMAASM